VGIGLNSRRSGISSEHSAAAARCVNAGNSHHEVWSDHQRIFNIFQFYCTYLPTTG
jgi:hypothetical protein